MLATTTVLAGLLGFFFDIAPDPVPREGIDPSPLTTTAVAMDAEVVRIRVHPDHADVEAVFTMRNTGETPESLEVGFPGAARVTSWRLDDQGVTIQGWGGSKLQGFEAKVDGEPVQAVCKQPPGTERAWEEEGVYNNWFLWPMAFAAGQTRRVDVRYRVPTKDVNYTPEGFLKNRQFAYVLKTGKGWAGPIGSAAVVVTFADGLGPSHVTQAAPAPTRRDEAELAWQFDAFEPETDILVAYTVHEDAAAALAVFERALSTAPDDRAALVDAALAREALGRDLEAARTWHHLADLAGEENTTAAAWGPYVPADYRAATLYRRAGELDRAREVAARGAKRLERFLKSVREGYSPWWVLNKMYRTTDQALSEMLKVMQGWAEPAEVAPR